MYLPAHFFGHSKVAGILHARELARQLANHKVPITINAVNPGITAEGLRRWVGGSTRGSLQRGCAGGWVGQPGDHRRGAAHVGGWVNPGITAEGLHW